MLPVEDTPTEYQYPQRFIRRSASCHAIRVTLENIKSVAEWCGSHTWASSVVVPTWEPGRNVPGELVANVGDWVLRLPDGMFTVATDAQFRCDWVQTVVA